MSWVRTFFTSSIGRKVVMSLTGLFLISFLVVHLSINLLIFLPDNGLLFNEVSHFMETNIIIRIMEIVLLAGFIIHIVQSILVTIQNQKARPIKYKVSGAQANSTWYSRNMGILGTLIFIFLIIHMRHFFWETHFTENIPLDANGNLNLYKEVVETFSIWYYSLLYVISMGALAYHLLHGFQSSFRSIGIMHYKYTPLIKGVGFAFAILVPALFALMPVYFYLKQIHS